MNWRSGTRAARQATIPGPNPWPAAAHDCRRLRHCLYLPGAEPVGGDNVTPPEHRPPNKQAPRPTGGGTASSTETTFTITPKRKPPVKKALFLGAVLLVTGALVAQAFLATFAGDAAEQGVYGTPDPEQFVGDTQAYLAGLGEVEDVAGPLTAEAQAELDAREKEARAELEARIQEARAILDGALAAPEGLPAAPAGFVPGADVVPGPDAVPDVAPHALPALPGGVPSDLPDDLVWSSADAVFSEGGSGIPETPVPGAGEITDDVPVPSFEELLAQADALYAEAAALLDSEELAPVHEALADTPLAGVTAPEDGPSDAPGKADPDEEAARIAKEHAEALLGDAGGTFGDYADGLDAAYDAQAGIVAAVESILAEAQAIQAEAQAQIEAEVDARVADAFQRLEEAQGEVDAALADYLDRAEAARAEAEALVMSAVDAHKPDLEAEAAAQAERLMAAVAGLERVAEERTKAIEAEAASATQVLDRLEASHGMDMTAEKQRILAAASSAQQELRAALGTQEEMLVGAAESMAAEATQRVAGLQADAESAVGDLESTVSGAPDELLRIQAFAYGHAEAVADAELARIQETAGQAQEDLEAEVAAHATQTLRRAQDLNERTVSVLESNLDGIQGILDDAYGKVDLDLGVIDDVREDLETVPTPDREERAEHWSTVHTALQAGLGGVLGQGDALHQATAQALLVSQQASEELAGMAGV